MMTALAAPTGLLRRSSPILGPLLVVAVMIVFFGYKSDAFLSRVNLQALGQEGAELLLVSLAATLVILLGSIDLSVGATVTICGMSLAYFSVHGAPTAVLVVLCIGIGTAVGTVNGMLHVYGRIPSFLATLGMLFLLPGLGQQLYGAVPNTLAGRTLSDSIQTNIAAIPTPLVIALAALAAVAVILRSTVFGRHMYAVGGNERVALLGGVSVPRTKILAFMIGGTLSGLAGLLMTVRIASATADMGNNLLLPAIAAVVIGGTPLTGGQGGPLRTLLGVALLTVLVNGMQVMSVDPFTMQIVEGVVVIVAVALAARRRLQRGEAIIK